MSMIHIEISGAELTAADAHRREQERAAPALATSRDGALPKEDAITPTHLDHSKVRCCCEGAEYDPINIAVLKTDSLRLGTGLDRSHGDEDVMERLVNQPCELLDVDRIRTVDGLDCHVVALDQGEGVGGLSGRNPGRIGVAQNTSPSAGDSAEPCPASTASVEGDPAAGASVSDAPAASSSSALNAWADEITQRTAQFRRTALAIRATGPSAGPTWALDYIALTEAYDAQLSSLTALFSAAPDGASRLGAAFAALLPQS